MRTLLDWAKLYVSRGFSVIPILAGEKKPLVPWIEYQKRMPTEEELKRWFTSGINNIAVVTGSISNLAVVDIDTEEGKQEITKYIPETIVTPTVTTPRGGQHLYFRFPSETVRNNAGKIPGCDFRGEGGYVLVPPSRNGDKKQYIWSVDILHSVEELPIEYINYINNSFIENINNTQPPSSDGTKVLIQGRRDSDLWKIGIALADSGWPPRMIEQILEKLALSCNPPFPGNEIKTKIASVMDRVSRKDRAWSKEVEEFIVTSKGSFMTSDIYNWLQVTSREGKKLITQALRRFQKEGLIEPVGRRNGIYQRVLTELEFIQFDDTEDVEFPIWLPFGLGGMVSISPGNIILVAGEFNAGKTSVCMEILKNNKNKVPIRYLSSEVASQGEFKRRWLAYRQHAGIPLKQWYPDEMTEYVNRSSDFAHALRPGALNIIDYLEFSEGDYTMGAEMMRQIHDHLQGGVAVVAVQKRKGQRLPRSGDMLLEKPRLAFSLSAIEGTEQGVAEVLKAKITRNSMKLDGKRLKYELTADGTEFRILNEWGWLKL